MSRTLEPHSPQNSFDDEDMTCRSGNQSAEEQRRSLLSESSSAADLEAADGSAAKPKPQVSRLQMCLCGLALLALFALALLPQHKPGAPPKPATVPTEQSLGPILHKAFSRALGGGVGGAVAGACQVLALMWLRTTMNYQYRHGGGLSAALSTLYAQGGIARFYQGLPYALLQTPLARFGDTASNVGVLALFAALLPETPMGLRTACGSAAGASWRIAITPLDTCKTSLQVEGPAAYQLLMRKARTDGVCTLWNGALGNAAANFVGSYPWFLAFNLMDELLPRPSKALIGYRLLRSAAMGTIATGISDVASNSIRVVKTTMQTSATQMSYFDATQLVLAADGWWGLLFRGLGTRLLANVLQSALFAVVWKYIEGVLNGS